MGCMRTGSCWFLAAQHEQTSQHSLPLEAGPGRLAAAGDPDYAPCLSLSPAAGKETVNTLYGTRVAVLAGDFLFAQSSWLIANLENMEVSVGLCGAPGALTCGWGACMRHCTYSHPTQLALPARGVPFPSAKDCCASKGCRKLARNHLSRLTVLPSAVLRLLVLLCCRCLAAAAAWTSRSSSSSPGSSLTLQTGRSARRAACSTRR